MRTKTRRGRIVMLPLLLLVLLLCGCGTGEEPAAPAYRQISQEEAAELMAREDCLVVDVRRPDEFAAGHIPGAINVPNKEIRDEAPEALPDRDRLLLIYCRSGNRSKQAAGKLADLGYTNVCEFGGVNTWPGELVTELTEPEPEPEPEPVPEPEPKPTIDYLVLVDADHRLPGDWEDSLRLEDFVNAVGDEVRVERTAYAAYLRLKEDLAEEGVYVDLDSAYRSVAEQQAIVDEFTEKYGAAYARTYAAVPGTSEHHTGLALDLFLIVDGEIVYENEDLIRYPDLWSVIHARLPDYGFILRYPGGNGYAYEPWHVRYVGPEAAREMTDRGLTLEEYLSAS